MSSLNSLVKNQSGLNIWNMGLHKQVDNKPCSSTKMWDTTLYHQVYEVEHNVHLYA